MKSKVVKDNSNPEWDLRRRFENFGEDQLKDLHVEMSVWNKSSVSSKLIGRATITISGGSLPHRPILIHGQQSWVIPR